MKNKLRFIMPAALATLLLGSCTKMDKVGILNTGNFSDTTGGPLKSASDITMGFAVENNLFMNNAAYKATVVREVSSVTFGNELKYGSVVQSNGTFNFTTADNLFNAATAAGLTVFGHVLGWHQQQNATYLKSYTGLTVPAATELLVNGTFENDLNNFATYNASGATISVTTAAAEVHGGAKAMKVVNPTPHAGQQYLVQQASDLFNTVNGRQYTISYWVKALAAGGSIRLSTQTNAGGSAQYQGDQTIGSTWQLITWTITANSSQTRILFDMGQVANTYYIDDVSVKEVVNVASGAQVALKADTALKNWITAAVGRYAGKIKAWDVINELQNGSGNIRTTANNDDGGTSNLFFWGEYLGRDFPYKAFMYAAAADPNAKLFINDYALESRAAKLDSLTAMVKELKARGAKVDGIGTQMHIAWNTSYAGIDAMMQKLAATGLLIRISELDVAINPLFKPNFVLTPLESSYQAAMYKYVVQSYLKYVPKAQQYGITIWGVDDATSWLYKNGTDYTDLFNADYSKKQAYSAVLQALKGQ